MLTDGPTDEERRIVSEHFAYLEKLLAAGTLILVGRTTNSDDRTFGIAIFQAESDDAARAIMNSDPAVRHGVMRAELFPYRVALFNNTYQTAD
jgi:uncharacterized protein YciI